MNRPEYPDNDPWRNVDSARPPMPKKETLRAAEEWPSGVSVTNVWGSWDFVAAATNMAVQGMQACKTLTLASLEQWQRALQDSKFNIENASNSLLAQVGSYFALYDKYLTEAEVTKWVKIDHQDHKKDNETSVGGRYYSYMKEEMQKKLEGYPSPLRSFIKLLLMHNADIQEWMRGDVMAKKFGSIDTILHDVYEKQFPKEVENLRWHGTLYDEHYNHKFLTETSRKPGQHHGKIVAANVDDIVTLFAKRTDAGAKRAEDYPHIIITSSHAQGETLKDVMSITHGIEAMARESEGRELPHGYIDEGIKPGQTLTIYACDVEETPWKNGAALLRRINELKRIAKTGEPDREFKEISPGAKRIAKLILKCMVERPELIDVDAPESMAKITRSHRSPITLRADAAHIAHHFKLVGYSKGGNVVSDALRYLVSELTATGIDHKPVFITHAKYGRKTARMEPADVREIVRGIACMALASVEVGMDQFYKEHGVRRVSINNEKDLVSAHGNYGSELYDERWIIRGTGEYLGHAPQHLMGTRGLDKEFAKRGYAHDDPRVARRLKEFFAAHFGRAAISRLEFGTGAARGEVILHTGTGTTDAQLTKRESVIRKACKDAGLRVTGFKPDASKPGSFVLQCAGANFATDDEATQKLRTAFQTMLDEKGNGLVVAQTIVHEEEGDIVTRVGLDGETYAPRSELLWPGAAKSQQRQTARA